MRVGFTGTREGMTRLQASKLQFILSVLSFFDRSNHAIPKFLYGTHEEAELKADAEAAKIAEALGYELVPFSARRGTELERDRAQVAVSDIQIAAPKTDKEVLRSGTWATVRYARAAGLPVIMLPRGPE